MSRHIELYREYYQNKGAVRPTKPTPMNKLVESLCTVHNFKDVLDYGSGGARALSMFPPEGVAVYDYDPAIDGIGHPISADLVVCNHMLEHVESEVDAVYVLREIKRLARRMAYIAISLEHSTKELPDGTPWHTLVKPALWWDSVVSDVFGQCWTSSDAKEATYSWERK